MNDATAEAPESSAPVEAPAAPDSSNGLFDSTSGEDASPVSDSEAAPSAEPAAPGAERPDYLGEQFWNADTGTPNVEGLAKSYNDIRGQNNKLLSDAQAKGGKAPENAEDYLVDYKPPHRSRPIGDEKEGEVLNKFANLKKDDPLFKAFSKGAKEIKLSVAQFNDFMQSAMEELHPLLPEKFNRENEMELLGDGGEEMVKVNSKWGNSLYEGGVLNEDEHKRLQTLASNAVGIQLLNKLRLNSGEKPIPGKLNGNANKGRKTPDECRAMMADERYNAEGPAGDAFRTEVDKAFAETFGTDPV